MKHIKNNILLLAAVAFFAAGTIATNITIATACYIQALWCVVFHLVTRCYRDDLDAANRYADHLERVNDRLIEHNNKQQRQIEELKRKLNTPCKQPSHS